MPRLSPTLVVFVDFHDFILCPRSARYTRWARTFLVALFWLIADFEDILLET